MNQGSRFCEWNPDWLLAGLSSREGFIVVVVGVEKDVQRTSESFRRSASDIHSFFARSCVEPQDLYYPEEGFRTHS